MTAERSECGMALIACLLAMALVLAVSAGLILAASLETRIAASFRAAHETAEAARSAAERALLDLPGSSSWTSVLTGAIRSPFVDGAPGGVRSLGDGSVLNLTTVLNLANCGRRTNCTPAQMNAVTADRPWGMNNPRWQLFAYGPMRALVPGAPDSAGYLIVLVADDGGENDGDPLVDGADPGNPGSGVLRLRAEAFGPRGRHKGFELTVERAATVPRVVSFQEIFQLDRP